jgi:hypothetical protein
MALPVKSLIECSLRVIMANLDGIDNLGTLPYRLAKPILTVMSAEKLLEIERNSPVSPLTTVQRLYAGGRSF